MQETTQVVDGSFSRTLPTTIGSLGTAETGRRHAPSVVRQARRRADGGAVPRRRFSRPELNVASRIRCVTRSIVLWIRTPQRVFRTRVEDGGDAGRGSR